MKLEEVFYQCRGKPIRISWSPSHKNRYSGRESSEKWHVFTSGMKYKIIGNTLQEAMEKLATYIKNDPGRNH